MEGDAKMESMHEFREREESVEFSNQIMEGVGKAVVFINSATEDKMEFKLNQCETAINNKELMVVMATSLRTKRHSTAGSYQIELSFASQVLWNLFRLIKSSYWKGKKKASWKMRARDKFFDDFVNKSSKKVEGIEDSKRDFGSMLDDHHIDIVSKKIKI